VAPWAECGPYLGCGYPSGQPAAVVQRGIGATEWPCYSEDVLLLDGTAPIVAGCFGCCLVYYAYYVELQEGALLRGVA